MFKVLTSTSASALCALVLAGCLHSTRPPLSVVAAVASPVVAEQTLDTTPSRSVSRRGIQKAYFVGRLVDPKYPELMHGSGIVFRRERAEAWNLSMPAEDGTGYETGPIRSLPNGSEIRGMTVADAEIQEARTSSMLDALLEQNAELTGQLADATRPAAAVEPKMGTVASVPPKAVTPPSITATRAKPSQPDAETLVTIAPSADNIIELSPSLLEPPIPGLTNPFRQRYQFETQLRETKIVVSGIALGPQPSCVLGDRIYNVGDSFESFTIASIDGDGIFLRKESFLLRIPMQDTPIQLRYP